MRQLEARAAARLPQYPRAYTIRACLQLTPNLDGGPVIAGLHRTYNSPKPDPAYIPKNDAP
jgi:hypothetical protein